MRAGGLCCRSRYERSHGGAHRSDAIDDPILFRDYSPGRFAVVREILRRKGHLDLAEALQDLVVAREVCSCGICLYFISQYDDPTGGDLYLRAPEGWVYLVLTKAGKIREVDGEMLDYTLPPAAPPADSPAELKWKRWNRCDGASDCSTISYLGTAATE
jgi:hypothetical protein